LLKFYNGLEQKRGDSSLHKGHSRVAHNIRENNKEQVVSLTIYINTAPAVRENKTTGETFFSTLVGTSAELRATIPQADVLNWNIQEWQKTTLDAEIARLLDYKVEESCPHIVLPTHEVIDAFFQAKGDLRLAIVCDSVQHGQVTEGVNPNTNKNERRMAIWPEGEYSIELFKPVAKAKVSSATADRLRENKQGTPVALNGQEPF